VKAFLIKVIPPTLILLIGLGAWEIAVRASEIPVYILPGPVAIVQALITDWGTLYPSLLVTLAITAGALTAATVLGVAIAVLFAQSKWIELSFFPYAVILQVTPVVAIAPLIIIWVKDTATALLICAWIVAFFPIVSNTTLGLNSTDHNLLNLLQLYGASRRQVFWYLRLPSALPYFLGGLRISGGLALIGAVVAEFVASDRGLGNMLLEANGNLNTTMAFGSIFVLSALGFALYGMVQIIERLVIPWHVSQRADIDGAKPI